MPDGTIVEQTIPELDVCDEDLKNIDEILWWTKTIDEAVELVDRNPEIKSHVNAAREGKASRARVSSQCLSETVNKQRRLDCKVGQSIIGWEAEQYAKATDGKNIEDEGLPHTSEWCHVRRKHVKVYWTRSAEGPTWTKEFCRSSGAQLLQNVLQDGLFEGHGEWALTQHGSVFSASDVVVNDSPLIVSARGLPSASSTA